MMMTMSDSIHFSVMKEVVFLKNNITLFLQVSTLFPFSFLFFFFFFFFFGWPHHMACGILVLRPGIEPRSLVVKVQSLNHWTARECLEVVLIIKRITSTWQSYDKCFTLNFHCWFPHFIGGCYQIYPIEESIWTGFRDLPKFTQLVSHKARI